PPKTSRARSRGVWPARIAAGGRAVSIAMRISAPCLRSESATRDSMRSITAPGNRLAAERPSIRQCRSRRMKRLELGMSPAPRGAAATEAAAATAETTAPETAPAEAAATPAPREDDRRRAGTVGVRTDTTERADRAEQQQQEEEHQPRGDGGDERDAGLPHEEAAARRADQRSGQRSEHPGQDEAAEGYEQEQRKPVGAGVLAAGAGRRRRQALSGDRATDRIDRRLEAA